MAKYIFKPTDIKEMKDSYDLVIIGSGGTGMVAALQAKELGLSPVILEKMDKMGGNTNRASSGMNAAETDFQLQHHIVDSFEDFYQETLTGGGGLNNKEMLNYFTSHGALAVDWLADRGIELNDITITGGMKIKRTHRPASKAAIGGYLVTELLKQVEKEEIPLFAKVKVDKLIADGDKVTGLDVQLPNDETKEISAKAVILATGGFGANKELLKKYRPDLDGYDTTNQAGATGDGIKLATEIGAGLVDMDQVQVHPTVQQDTGHAYLIGEATRGEGAILVNAKGERFVNELDTRKNVTNAINELPEKSAYLIYDSGIRENVPAIDFYDHIGLVEHGDSLADLAANIDVDPETLQATVASWNEVVTSGQDSVFGRDSGMDRTIDHGGYEAIHIAPAVHYTMGGLKIDAKTHVLTESGQPIAGLFAGGEVAGGLHGNNRIGGNSIAETVVFGRQTGQQAYKYLANLK
ncbi:flavocytochrome c [Ligilactobacillus pobuzihii]|uniref:Fumarate reductase flavoprotein subunit n=1 Tax=Ligilactobacillus pobuzihii TaxID=449659 RepID=A0A0R2L978_9LACO|nr:flavocytochrome c [Ligilactobacillus pobuzihii]KRK10705.1 fumarate reductase flavoprotein subunit [Ligilactobacillus pobuzihii E100301 = KCTC 13174]KRN98033.1 fumarate reductase flavoprotein subunit [Ligilactobacillus pobuzihii]GEN47536.1 flavocytochrome c [Ligilactobacillus pobuzihii]